MSQSRPTSLYGALVRLYPRDFRQEYGADLVQHFRDLVADVGRRAAWKRTVADLLVTVPRYRLEAVMPDPHSTATLQTTIVLLAVAGVVGVLTGFKAAAVLLVVAIALAAAQRSKLALAISTPTAPSARRRRFWIASVAAIVAMGALVSYANAIRDEEISGASLVLHNVIGVPAMVLALGFLLAGLAAPRTGPPAWLPAGVVLVAFAIAVPQVDGDELNEAWWTVMALAGLVGFGLIAMGVLSAFSARTARTTAL